MRDPAATDALGAALAEILQPGDTLLLDGPIGAGKSHLARALIMARFRAAGLEPPDVPSPTYTLMQPYALPTGEILHADLYRLGDPSELAELGLTDCFGTALCLVEWPDRLGHDRPCNALSLSLGIDGQGRTATFRGGGDWPSRLGPLSAAMLAPQP